MSNTGNHLSKLKYSGSELCYFYNFFLGINGEQDLKERKREEGEEDLETLLERNRYGWKFKYS